jgi:hypothetical protein
LGIAENIVNHVRPIIIVNPCHEVLYFVVEGFLTHNHEWKMFLYVPNPMAESGSQQLVYTIHEANTRPFHVIIESLGHITGESFGYGSAGRGLISYGAVDLVKDLLVKEGESMIQCGWGVHVISLALAFSACTR